MEWPRQPYIGYPVTLGTINDEGETSSYASSGHAEMRANVAGSGTWPVANKAWYYPVYVTGNILIQNMMWRNGATIAGNVDLGIYSRDGVRIASSGSTAHAGVNIFQSVAVSCTLTPELYFFAMAMSTNTATVFRWTYGATLGPLINQTIGLRSSITSFALPANALTAGWSGDSGDVGDWFPIFVASGRALV